MRDRLWTRTQPPPRRLGQYTHQCLGPGRQGIAVGQGLQHRPLRLPSFQPRPGMLQLTLSGQVGQRGHSRLEQRSALLDTAARRHCAR